MPRTATRLRCTASALRPPVAVAADSVAAGGVDETAADVASGLLRSHSGTNAKERQYERPQYYTTTRDNTPQPYVNQFGVSTVVPGLGVLPKKVYSVEAARECLRHDGAVILAGLSTELTGKDAFRDTALALPEQLFGDELLAVGEPTVVGAGPYNPDTATSSDKEWYRDNWGAKEAVEFPPWHPNVAHNDGQPHSDFVPPYFALVFVNQAGDGGDNALVSVDGVLEGMAADPVLAPLAELLPRVPVDPRPITFDTKPGGKYRYETKPEGDSASSSTSSRGVAAASKVAVNEQGSTDPAFISPIVRPAPGGRRIVTMATGGQHPASATQKRAAKAMRPSDDSRVSTNNRAGWDEEEAYDRDQRMIDGYKDAVFSATAHAPRFKVQPGEAIIVDNYKLWHIREGFTSLERKSWRVWMWKEGDCYGVADTQRTAYRKYT